MDALSAGNLEDNSIFLCDDDNDLELAMSCRLAFVPFATSKGMSDLISKHPRKIVCVIGTGKNGVGNDDTTSMETTHCTELVLESILLLGK